MCLLINQKKGYTFSHAWLADFYDHNEDGIGVMYAKDGVIHVAKVVPNTLADLVEFYHEHAAGKECAIHFRMRTHGATDLLNCHPYEIFSEEDGYPLYLMHNGILSTGNAADTTKSDTWHYIEDFIKPALRADPTQFTAPWFKRLIQSHIGYGNKFVIADALGNVETFNETQGVMFEGNWMSNEYAWSAPRPKHLGTTASLGYGAGYGSGYGSWGYEDAYTGDYKQIKKFSTDERILQDDNEYDLEAEANYFYEMVESALWDLGMQRAYSTVDAELIAEMYLNDSAFAMQWYADLLDGFITEAEILESLAWDSGFSSHETNGHLNVGMG